MIHLRVLFPPLAQYKTAFYCKSSSSRDCKVAGQGHGGLVPFGRDAQMKQHAWVKKVAPYGDGRQRAARNAIYL